MTNKDIKITKIQMKEINCKNALNKQKCLKNEQQQQKTWAGLKMN